VNARDIPLCEGLRQEFAKRQARADSVAQLFGDFAPPWFAGESDLAYRRRLVGQYQKYSPTWRDAEIGTLSGRALETVESQIFADAAREARQPTSLTLRPGELVERVSTDATGRRITKFHGDPEACWAPFKVPSRAVVGWATK
jgi:hypothetical protein